MTKTPWSKIMSFGFRQILLQTKERNIIFTKNPFYPQEKRIKRNEMQTRKWKRELKCIEMANLSSIIYRWKIMGLYHDGAPWLSCNARVKSPTSPCVPHSSFPMPWRTITVQGISIQILKNCCMPQSLQGVTMAQACILNLVSISYAPRPCIVTSSWHKSHTSFGLFCSAMIVQCLCAMSLRHGAFSRCTYIF